MILPPQDWFFVALYAMFWPIRINGCVRRGRQPLLRGRDWFFDVRVRDGFYDGPGRAIIRHYWLRMMIPFAVDLPWAIWIFATGTLVQLNALILVVSAVIHVNHLLSVRLAERRAQPYAVPESTRPASCIALSLAPRRLRDYTHVRFESTLAAIGLATLAWLVRYYTTSPLHPSPRAVFGQPLFMLYVQTGMLIVKRAVIGWPSPMPQDQADAFMLASEERRRYYVKMWDWARAAAVSSMVMWTIFLALPRPAADRLATVWLGTWIVLGLAATVLVEIKRKQIARLASLTNPVSLPDFRESDLAAWPVCWEPSAPALMLKSARGYSLNLGNSIAKCSAAYVAGFAALIFILTHMAP